MRKVDTNKILMGCFFISCFLLFWFVNQTVPVESKQLMSIKAENHKEKNPEIRKQAVVKGSTNIERETAAMDEECDEVMNIEKESIKEAAAKKTKNRKNRLLL